MLVLNGPAKQSLGSGGRFWRSGASLPSHFQLRCVFAESSSVVLGSTPGATQVSVSGQWAVQRQVKYDLLETSLSLRLEIVLLDTGAS